MLSRGWYAVFVGTAQENDDAPENVARSRSHVSIWKRNWVSSFCNVRWRSWFARKRCIFFAWRIFFLCEERDLERLFFLSDISGNIVQQSFPFFIHRCSNTKDADKIDPTKTMECTCEIESTITGDDVMMFTTIRG